MKIIEHKSRSYAPRTYVNAGRAELTVAFAVDFSSAGERLTHKAAGSAYLAIPLNDDFTEAARTLFRHCRYHKVKVLNIAGNGIYTIRKYSNRGAYPSEEALQAAVNKWVYLVIAKVHEFWPLEMIVSGGQTGVDLAGGIAAEMLGISCEMTMPKGYKQRHEDGVDVDHTEQEILTQVAYYKGVLSREVYGYDIPQ